MQTVKQIMRHMESLETMKDFRNETLRIFDRYFGLERSIFWLCGKGGVIHDPVVHNIKPVVLESYVDYVEDDFLLPARVQANLDTARVLRLNDVVTESEYERSAFYQEFMEPNGNYHEMGVYLVSGNQLVGGISFTAGRRNPFENEMILESVEVISYYVSMKLQTFLQRDPLERLELTPEYCTHCRRPLIRNRTRAQSTSSLPSLSL